MVLISITIKAAQSAVLGDPSAGALGAQLSTAQLYILSPKSPETNHMGCGTVCASVLIFLSAAEQSNLYSIKEGKKTQLSYISL